MPHEQIEDSYQEETCENCGDDLGDNAPLYEDANVCRKCHEEIEKEEASLNVESLRGYVCKMPDWVGAE